MPDRTKLLVHLRRISNLFGKAFREGPDGTLEGRFGQEHPASIHDSCSFYLAGCLAFLEGESGAYSWNTAGASQPDFDAFASRFPPPPKDSFAVKGVSNTNLDALAEIRNAVTHNNGDLSRNRNRNSLALVPGANLPGVVISGAEVTLEEEFLGYVRICTLAVRNYHGEF